MKWFRKTELTPETVDTSKTDLAIDLQSHELILYKYDSCPYCHRVMRVIQQMNLLVLYRDTKKDSDFRQELKQLTGKTQVPCLLIDGKPMLESLDIIRYLKDNYPPCC